MEAAAVLARVEELRREVKAEKSAINLHRRRLHIVAEQLQNLEAHAKRCGLALNLESGVGSTSHGLDVDARKS